ncbi:nucleotide sugar dehydrogenase [Thiomicrorhabdus sp.]|uniref:nucleotide sugar dehydrogenase n=1 Tax=Thiomicrorhabdus sp. TaxID=2039724 RepID=UPI0029C766AA|nr:nucleotide sugar dehydrogenase [Thiomicrorhabdus sp.]
MNVNVFGSNISAMVCAACLAETGNQVTLVGQPKTGSPEPGLSKLIGEQTASGRLNISSDYDLEADVHILSLSADKDKKALEIAERLSDSANPDHCLIIRSNLDLKTIQEIERKANMPVIVNPDFTAEGQAISGFQKPDRIIVGSDDEKALKRFKLLFAPFNRNRDIFIQMSPQAAVLTKYATNVLIATRISLMNELARVAESTHADIEEIRQGLGSDKRIGFTYLYPGIGFGGVHLSRDLQRMQKLLDKSGSQQGLLKTVYDINQQQKELLFRKAWQHYRCELDGRHIAMWGVTYKPNSSVIKEAPSLTLIEAFIHQGCHLHLYDPNLGSSFHNWVNKTFDAAQQARIHIHLDMYEAIRNTDALCVTTEAKLFWSPDLKRLKENMNVPMILDGRNIYDKQWMEEEGMIYYGVGR